MIHSYILLDHIDNMWDRRHILTAKRRRKQIIYNIGCFYNSDIHIIDAVIYLFKLLHPLDTLPVHHV